MTRQNCKNCGEPYTFDNLVTPGRATMVCSACQRKIYIHTGQIHFETPSSHISTNTSVKISLGQGVSIVQEASSTKRGSSAVAEKKALPLKQWQSVSYEDTEPKKTEFHAEEIKFSGNQSFVLAILYLFSLIWVIFSIVKLIELMNDASFSWDNVESVVTSAFYAVVSIALAEGLKSFWKGLN